MKTKLIAFISLLFCLTASLSAKTLTYYYTDKMDSVVMATDQSGTVLYERLYTPYGGADTARPLPAVVTPAENPGFAGHPQDAFSGLTYMKSRWYSEDGLFLSIDPAGISVKDPFTINPYVYANNNPYRYTDPNGESPIDLLFLGIDSVNLGIAIYKGEGIAEAAVNVGLSTLGVLSPVPGTGQAIKAARGVRVAVDSAGAGLNKTGVETVQRWMSKAELEATQNTGLLRGGRDGTHYVTDAASADPLRARQRLSLPQTPEVRVTLEVPEGVFSKASRVDPAFNMPGGGMERTASGNIPVEVLDVR